MHPLKRTPIFVVAGRRTGGDAAGRQTVEREIHERLAVDCDRLDRQLLLLNITQRVAGRPDNRPAGFRHVVSNRMTCRPACQGERSDRRSNRVFSSQYRSAPLIAVPAGFRSSSDTLLGAVRCGMRSRSSRKHATIGLATEFELVQRVEAEHHLDRPDHAIVGSSWLNPPQNERIAEFAGLRQAIGKGRSRRLRSCSAGCILTKVGGRALGIEIQGESAP